MSSFSAQTENSPVAKIETNDGKDIRTGILENNIDGQIQTDASQNRSVVRVSLDKLDDLVELNSELTLNSSIFEQNLADFGKQIAEFSKQTPGFEKSNDKFDLLKSNLDALFDNQRRLIEEMNEKLLRLRMVSFASLSGRLQRTAHVACEEEEKFAELVFEGENLEIDTQILDWLIEPLLHLLRNAVAHGIEAPELRRLLGKPETGKIFLHIQSEKSQIVVAVSDDGRGISVDALKEKAIVNNFISREKAETMSDAEAFELIFLPGLTTAEKLSQIAGRGVGMNIVKNRIERRSGTIIIDSEAQKGTTFTLILPASFAQTWDIKEKADRQNSAASLNLVGSSSQTFVSELPIAGKQSFYRDENQISVLIVDDSPSFCRTISSLIKNAGWHFSTALNGIEALEFLQSGRKLPDVILTDAEMPRMNGFELLREIKSSEFFRHIPVIMITSRTDEKSRRNALDAGVSAYLTKSFDGETLLNKIRILTGTIT
jgi:chemotaxis protein histidine kinase CheA